MSRLASSCPRADPSTGLALLQLFRALQHVSESRPGAARALCDQTQHTSHNHSDTPHTLEQHGKLVIERREKLARTHKPSPHTQPTAIHHIISLSCLVDIIAMTQSQSPRSSCHVVCTLCLTRVHARLSVRFPPSESTLTARTNSTRQSPSNQYIKHKAECSDTQRECELAPSVSSTRSRPAPAFCCMPCANSRCTARSRRHAMRDAAQTEWHEPESATHALATKTRHVHTTVLVLTEHSCLLESHPCRACRLFAAVF
jgi:hypothetical protein